MKKIILLFTCLILTMVLTGCSLFTSGSGKKETKGSIKISEDVTHEDPSDLEYAARYVCYSGEIAVMSEELYEPVYGIVLESQYVILYADKEDKALRAYYYFVFDTAESAEIYKGFLKDYEEEEELTVTGSTVSYFEDETTIEEMIDMNIAMGIMDEKTAKAYAEYCKMADELIDYTGE